MVGPPRADRLWGVDDDARHIARIAHGDDHALRELHDGLARHVFGLALRITSNREDAEEVLQDTFVQVHRAADRFDPTRGSARAWIYSIARNLARMRVRSRASRPAPDARGVTPVRTSSRPGPEAAASDRLALERAFEHLDEHEVHLLRDAFFGGFSHAELAERDDVPLGTVKSRLRRALKKARSALTGSSTTDAHGSDGASS